MTKTRDFGEVLRAELKSNPKLNKQVKRLRKQTNEQMANRANFFLTKQGKLFLVQRKDRAVFGGSYAYWTLYTCHGPATKKSCLKFLKENTVVFR